MSNQTYTRATRSTYSAQSELPRLPVPTLEETLKRFPHVLAALSNDTEKAETEKIVDEFLHGDGPKLQALLEKYDEEGRKSGRIGSYVEEFWNDSYLAPDLSVVLNLNPFFVLQDGPDPRTAQDQICRAAALVFASIKLAYLLKREELKPDLVKGIPLCMDQFKSLFGSCRVPQKDNKDTVSVYPDSTHVAVMCRNQLYYFQALWPSGEVAVNETDISDILRAIKNDASKTDIAKSSKTALGVLTSLPRAEWADARAKLAASSASNSEALQLIDSALFVVVLDDYIPKNADEAASNMLHGTYCLDDDDVQVGTCCNRWYDKLQIIVCANGTAGTNFEHSSIDGHTALRLVSDVFAETVVNFAQSITKSVYGKDHLPHVVDAKVKRAALSLGKDGRPMLDVFPKKIVLYHPANIVERIFFAETALGDEIVASDTVVLEFKKFGKLLIVANNMSPDSFVQMSIQLAYFILYGRIVCTYEAVQTKHFFHGRTEAMRTATPEAATFCRMWHNELATKEEKLDALRKATVEHTRLVRECAGGKGVDRHLFALKCIAERNNLAVPPFFHSKAWKKLNHTVLSTSNCGNPSLRLFGFGPVVPDGFGIGYIIKDSAIQYSVSSKHRQTRRFVHAIERALVEIQSFLKPLSVMEVNKGVVRKDVADALKRTKSLRNVAAPRSLSKGGEYRDIWGENSSLPENPPESEEPVDRKPKEVFTRYFPNVRRGRSLSGSKLASIGRNIGLEDPESV